MEPLHPLLGPLVGLSLWLVALLVIGILLAMFFWYALSLWMGARAVGAEKATFGRAVSTTLLIVLALVAVGAGVVFLLWVQPRPIWILWVSLGVAVAAYPVIMVSFIKGGFEVPVGRAIGVWAASIGLRAMINTALMIILVPLWAGATFRVAGSSPAAAADSRPAAPASTAAAPAPANATTAASTARPAPTKSMTASSSAAHRSVGPRSSTAAAASVRTVSSAVPAALGSARKPVSKAAARPAA